MTVIVYKNNKIDLLPSKYSGSDGYSEWKVNN